MCDHRVHVQVLQDGIAACSRRPVATKKTLTTFHYTGWFLGTLIMVYYNPHIAGQYNPLYNPTNQGSFHCSPVFGMAMDSRLVSGESDVCSFQGNE